MLSIQEMKRVQPFTQFKEGLPNIFVFPVVDGFASHILKMLMYRLENLEQQSYVVLEDRGKVDKKDIETGNYIDTDMGKGRAQVLSERYGGTFTTTVINRVERIQDEMYLRTNKAHNVFMITIGSSETYEGNKLKTMVEATYGQNGETRGNLYLVNAFYNGENVIIKTQIANNGKAIGVSDMTRTRNVGFSVSEQYVRNAMAGQMVFNILNTIVTEGMELPYSKIQGSMEKGLLKKEYIKGRDVTSITSRVDVFGEVELTEDSYEFDGDFKQFEEKNKEWIEKRAKSSAVMVNPKRLIGYAEMVSSFITDADSNKKERKTLREAKELMVLFLESTKKRGHRWTVDRVYLLAVQVAYIESKKGSIWSVPEE